MVTSIGLALSWNCLRVMGQGLAMVRSFSEKGDRTSRTSKKRGDRDSAKGPVPFFVIKQVNPIALHHIIEGAI
jgi:hypothetical protein